MTDATMATHDTTAPSFQADDAIAGLTALIDEKKPFGGAWVRWLAPLLSLAMFAVAVREMNALNVGEMMRALPRTPAFWIALGGAYLLLPASEWVIYRRLWRLPAAGLVPLLRKYVSNEILLGYSGELYFYAWARRRLRFAGAPFGAVKDVAVLSAQAGNVATVVMLAAVWPWVGMLHLGAYERDILLSCLAATTLSIPVFLFRNKLFALPTADLQAITGIHLVRIAGTLLLTALAWHAALPEMAFSLWLLLAAIRQLLSRLPFMPNKDLAFAALAMFLLGPHTGAAGVVAISATLLLCGHLLLGVTLGAAELLGLDEGL